MNLLLRYFDRLPVLPMWVILTLGAVMGFNGLLNLTVDSWNSPAWIGLTLLVTFFALLWRVVRAEQKAAQHK
jgi:hypothetical protein